jgi:ABC transporter substrate binding protein
VVGALANPNNPNAAPQVRDLQTAARAFGLQLIVLNAGSAQEIDSAFATLSQHRIRALVVTADGFLISRQEQLVGLAARHAVPTMYPLRQYVAGGGLVSYGANLAEEFRGAGNNVGRVLNGAKPADLPVEQPTKFELVINLKTAIDALSWSPGVLASSPHSSLPQEKQTRSPALECSRRFLLHTAPDHPSMRFTRRFMASATRRAVMSRLSIDGPMATRTALPNLRPTSSGFRSTSSFRRMEPRQRWPAGRRRLASQSFSPA